VLPYVAQLMTLPASDPRVAQHGAIIKRVVPRRVALGGAFFGRLGDLLGRSAHCA